MELDDLDLSQIRNNSVSKALERLKAAQTEEAKLQVIQDAVDEIKKSLSQVVVSRIKEDITVSNLDQIQLYLRKELSKAFAPLVAELKSFKSMSKQANDMKMKMDTDHMDALHDSFDVMVVRKPKTEIRVTNLSEIKPLEEIKVNNLSELQAYFNSLSEVIRSTFNIEIPTPKVTVNVPDQPAPQVNLDLNPLLESIQRLQDSITSIKPSRTKYNTTDIVNALKELKTAFKNRQTIYTNASFPDIPTSFVNERGQSVSQELDILAGYYLADTDETTTTKYWGFTKSNGIHYILKETTSSGILSYRYYSGGTDTDYSTAWTNRASKSYDYFYTVF